MQPLTEETFLAFAKASSAKKFTTLTHQKSFRVRVAANKITFTLESGTERHEPLNRVADFVKIYAETKSTKGTDYIYQDGFETRNSSYLIALAKACETAKAMTTAKKWDRKELLLALNLYHQTPFGKQHKTHPPIVTLANQLGRTPSSIAMKLNNFTSLDPAEQKRGIKGLSGASKKDRLIWTEYADDFQSLAEESEALLEKEQAIPEGPTEIITQVKARRHQSFFRKAVLGSYGNSCAISGIPIPQLLRASHIIPWRKSSEHRLNPSNGICLSGTYDLAFDQFLITFDEDLHLVIGPRLKEQSSDVSIIENFLKIEGKAMRLPEKNIPDDECLAWHREQLV